MAGLTALYCVILLAVINRVYADPICTQEISAIGPNVVCTAGNAKDVLRRGLVSDNNRTAGIVLRNCGITKVEEGAFNALPSLEDLDLSQNNIHVLNPLFEETPNLKKLNLSASYIEEIKPQVFDPLIKLNSLDLSNNIIMGRNLDFRTFERCHNIEYLDFSGNLMTGTNESLLQALQVVKTLNLMRCSLQNVPDFATRPNLNTMTRLSLSFNQISRLHDSKAFSVLVDLKYLYISSNLIDFIHEDVFQPLKKIKSISLQNNKMTRLPENLFTNLRKLGSIDLSHNLIEYVPVNAFRYTGLRNLNLADNRFTYLQDNFCLELRNSGVRLQKFYFSQNPWQCACLNDILGEVKMIGIEYNGLKYNGRVPVCVTAKEFQCKRQMSSNEEYLNMYYNKLTYTSLV